MIKGGDTLFWGSQLVCSHAVVRRTQFANVALRFFEAGYRILRRLRRKCSVSDLCTHREQAAQTTQRPARGHQIGGGAAPEERGAAEELF